ncbi:MAG: hypothetical protein M1365_11950 [Actinobacteria bacterium]|nr:hypothetical protein [Actinomycetota bacterium]
MYECIVGKDDTGIWLLAVEKLNEAKDNVKLYKELCPEMDIRILEIDEDTLNKINNDVTELKRKFIEVFDTPNIQ